MTDSHGMQKCQIQDSNQHHTSLPAPTAFFIDFLVMLQTVLEFGPTVVSNGDKGMQSELK